MFLFVSECFNGVFVLWSGIWNTEGDSVTGKHSGMAPGPWPREKSAEGRTMQGSKFAGKCAGFSWSLLSLRCL